MKVVAMVPSASELVVVLVDGEKAAFTVPFYESWSCGDTDRMEDYVAIRKRIAERVASWKPDAVCVAPFEPAALKIKSHINAAWFRTAELRGVVAEASRSVCEGAQYRSGAAVTKTIGAGDSEGKKKGNKEKYVGNDAFWSGAPKLAKKYKEAAVIALSYIEEHADG